MITYCILQISLIGNPVDQLRHQIFMHHILDLGLVRHKHYSSNFRASSHDIRLIFESEIGYSRVALLRAHLAETWRLDSSEG